MVTLQSDRDIITPWKRLTVFQPVHMLGGCGVPVGVTWGQVLAAAAGVDQDVGVEGSIEPLVSTQVRETD